MEIYKRKMLRYGQNRGKRMKTILFLISESHAAFLVFLYGFKEEKYAE